MNALWPRSVGRLQPVDGARPPTVFTRWMNVVSNRVLPPVGPSALPTTSSRTQGIAVGETVATPVARAQTVLVSWESSQVTRTIPGSSGLRLEKCVMSCSPKSLNNVACGVNNTQSTCPTDGEGTQA